VLYAKSSPTPEGLGYFDYYLLVVLSLNLEVSLWVNTYWAYLRSLLANMDVTAV
jgi:hypothetical protein